MATWLLIQLTFPIFSGKTLVDRAQDPEMRLGLPMTYGICRTNVRKATRVGDELAFVMYVKEERRYYLAAWFVVAEAIDHAEASRRFPGRTNVLLQPPSTPDDETIEIGGVRWARASWDRDNPDHDDWKTKRAIAPYLVSDTTQSRIVRPAIPWETVVEASGEQLPGTLRNAFNRHPARRLDKKQPEVAEFLRAYVMRLEMTAHD